MSSHKLQCEVTLKVNNQASDRRRVHRGAGSATLKIQRAVVNAVIYGFVNVIGLGKQVRSNSDQNRRSLPSAGSSEDGHRFPA